MVRRLRRSTSPPSRPGEFQPGGWGSETGCVERLEPVSGRALAVAVAVLLLAATFFVVRGDERDPHRDGPLPARGQRLRGLRGADPRRQRRQGDRRDPRGQLGAGRDGVRRRVQAPRRRQGRHRHPDAGGRPVRAADAGLHGGGPVMEDGADIPLPDTAVPVELDRIYSSLRDLSEALGPNGVNKDGTLDHLLRPSRASLEGEGELGNQMIRNLSEAAADLRRRERGPLRHRRRSSRRSPRCWPRTTGWCARSSRTSRACRRPLVGERGRAPAGPGVGGPRGRHGRGVRPGQPQGAGHRPREAHPGREAPSTPSGTASTRPSRSARSRWATWRSRSTTRPARSAPGSASRAPSATRTACSARS